MNHAARTESSSTNERKIDWRFWRTAVLVVVAGAGTGIVARNEYDGQRRESRLRDRIRLLEVCSTFDESSEDPAMPIGCIAINGATYEPAFSGAVLQECYNHPDLDDLWRPIGCDGHTGTNGAASMPAETTSP